MSENDSNRDTDNDTSADSGDGARNRGFRGLATFGSTHHVLKAEKLLLEAGLDVRMVPMPREVSSDCGVALEFAYELAPEVRDTAGEAGLEVKKIHRLLQGRQTGR